MTLVLDNTTFESPVPGRFAGPDAALVTGLEHLRSGRGDAAIATLKEAIASDPGAIAAVRGLSAAYLAARRPADARGAVAGFVAANAMNESAWKLAAQLEWKLGDRAAAIALLRRGLERLPQSEAVNRLLALFLAATGQLEAASAHVNQPNASPATLRLRALCELAGAQRSTFLPDEIWSDSDASADAQISGTSSESAGDYLDRLAQSPRLIDALLRLPCDAAPLSRQMLAELEKRIERLVSAQPAHADRQVALARLRLRMNDHAGALAAADAAVGANPRLPDAHRARAEALAAGGDVEKAIGILTGLQKTGLAWPDIETEIRHWQTLRPRAIAQQRRSEAA